MVVPKKFRSDPYDNPNNYDLYINTSKIPCNIKLEKANNLQKGLQKLMPLSKTLHLQYNNPTTRNEDCNAFSINTRLKINNKEVKFK